MEVGPSDSASQNQPASSNSETMELEPSGQVEILILEHSSGTDLSVPTTSTATPIIVETGAAPCVEDVHNSTAMPVLQTISELDKAEPPPIHSSESPPPSLSLATSEVCQNQIVETGTSTSEMCTSEEVENGKEDDRSGDLNTTPDEKVDHSGIDNQDLMDVDKEIPTDPEQTPAPENAIIDPSYYYWKYNIPSELSKCLIQVSKEEFAGGKGLKKPASFLKGVKWAPDGTCLMSCSDDDNLRVFNFPSCFSSVQDWNTDADHNYESEEWKSVLKVKEGGLIYDYCWYPLMTSVDPISACFLTTSSLSPIHLWDAFTGKLRASYVPYNHLDQVVSASSIAFGLNGETIYAGFEKTLRIFNLTRPGRACVERKLKQQMSDVNQYGMIASIAVNPSLQSFYALGSFDKTVGLYYEDGSVICILQGHLGGVTHMKFSSDGLKLFTGGRKDSRLMCWDMRKLGEAYKIYDRVVDTHQRIYFDTSPDDRYLVSGGTDGIVKIWDTLKEDDQPCCSFRGSEDCINGVSLNPYVPLLVTSSGQRHFPQVVEDSDDEDLFDNSKTKLQRSCDIKLWKLV